MDVNRIRKIAVIVFCAITALGNVKSYMDGTAASNLQITQNQNSYYLDTSEHTQPYSEPEPEAQSAIDPAPLAQQIPADIEIQENSDNSGKINLNTATAEQLITIKGIGPAKAKAIIDYRNAYGGFVALEEIMEVKGIGEGTFNKIKDSITID